MNHSNSPQDETAPTGASVHGARRRLVRGAFATPAVLALYSGSAVAAASNLRCSLNQMANPQRPGAASASDAFVRVRLWSLRRWDGATPATGKPVFWFLSGSDLVSSQRFPSDKFNIGSGVLASNNWQQVNQPATGTILTYLGNPYVGQPLYRTVNNGGSESGVWKQDGAWIAVRFSVSESSNKITILGVVDGKSEGTALTGASCWTSFMTGA